MVRCLLSRIDLDLGPKASLWWFPAAEHVTDFIQADGSGYEWSWIDRPGSKGADRVREPVAGSEDADRC